MSNDNNNAEDDWLLQAQRNARTYVAGEDKSRLHRVAQALGAKQARNPNWHQALFFSDTVSAARMHSVGTLGQDEYLDRQGTIHLVTLQRMEEKKAATKPSYQGLHELFQPGEAAAEEVAEEEEEEVLVEDTVEGGSLTAAVFGIIKGMVGPAILYLPRGFQMSGWAVATLAMICSTLSYLYSARRLLECWKVENEKQQMLAKRMVEIQALLGTTPSSNPNSYGSVDDAEAADEAKVKPFTPVLLTYPELGRRAFGWKALVIDFGISAMQFGVCLTYLIFVPQNLYESTKSLFGVVVPKSHFLILMLLMEIPLSWIKDIRKLALTNMLATFLIAYGLLSCLIISFVYQAQQEDSPGIIASISELPPINDTWFLFIGTSFFVFEGSITLLVPLQEAVYKEEDKKKFTSVNARVISITVVFYIVFAIFCWAALGDSVRTALTASLPEGPFSTSVQFAYSIAVIFTFPLQAFPALEVTLGSYSKNIIWRNILATLCVCLLGVMAVYTIDYLGNVVSLLGSLVGIPIALIYPPLMHNVLVPDTTMATKICNYIVALVGVFAMAVASYTTITSWDEGVEG